MRPAFLFFVVIALFILTGSAFAQDSLFAPAVNYGLDIRPNSVFASDLDGDGDKDLAVANYGSDSVSILLNNGDGTYQTAVNYGSGILSLSVFAADLDGDGDNDLAVANWSDSVSVIKNNGNGTFQTAVNYFVGSYQNSIYSSDFDGDGDNDLAVASYNGGVSVLLNNGNGTFMAPVNYEAGYSPGCVFSSDLNGDGDNDLVVVNGSFDPNLGSVSVLLNNGDGTFMAPVGYESELARPSCVFPSDLDGDGNNDLAVASGRRGVFVLLNNGDATFQSAVNYGLNYARPYSIFASDLDGDGDNDLATANVGSYPGNVSVLLNNGDGTFQTEINYGADNGPISIFASDLDRDGDNDLAVANNVSNDISILINLTSETGIPDFGETKLPQAVSLSQNYPNPFNAQTTISYSLPTADRVVLNIYDIMGRKVANLFNSRQDAGEHNIIWNATDLPSGIYFARLESGGHSENIRMILLK